MLTNGKQWDLMVSNTKIQKQWENNAKQWEQRLTMGING